MENFNQNNPSFIGFIQEGKIYNSYGMQLGYTVEEYKKAVQTAKDFEKILYDKGILQKPKTPEEINKELQETLKQTQITMQQMAQSIASLNLEINSLKGQKNVNVEQTNCNESGGSISRTRKSKNDESSV